MGSDGHLAVDLGAVGWTTGLVEPSPVVCLAWGSAFGWRSGVVDFRVLRGLQGAWDEGWLCSGCIYSETVCLFSGLPVRERVLCFLLFLCVRVTRCIFSFDGVRPHQ